MAITLPNASTANTDSTDTNAANVTAAETAFVASTTVLINQAIANGFFMIMPYLPFLVTSSYVTTYFTALGYTVTFPIIPPGPFNPCFVAGFPEVLPPGYTPWNCGCGFTGLPRIQISWSA